MRLTPSGTGEFVEPIRVLSEIIGAGRVNLCLQCAPFVGVHHIDESESVVCTDKTVIIDRNTAFPSLLCRDQDNAGRTAAAVNGCSRTVLEHVDRLDVVRVDVFKGSAEHTVDYDQRLRIGTQGGQSPQADVKPCIRVAAWPRYGESGNLTLDELGRVLHITYVKVLRLNAGDGAGDLLALLRAIPGNDNFGESSNIGPECDIDHTLVPDFDLLGYIPNKGND